MVRPDVILDKARGLVVLQLVELPDRPLAYIELDGSSLQTLLHNLLAASVAMADGNAGPPAPGSFQATPAIMGPHWRMGRSPLDGTAVISFNPSESVSGNLWLNYALPASDATKLKNFLADSEWLASEGGNA